MFKLRWGPAAFVLSALALFIALGGTGYAVTQADSARPTSQTTLPSRAALPAWHTLTLRNGWTYGGWDSYRAAYYKDSQGIVHLRGSAANGSTADPAFRLPPGARPAHTLWLQVYAVNGTAGGLEIRPDGFAYLFDHFEGADVKGYSSLDGISFRVP
jgi:hypothetical protein